MTNLASLTEAQGSRASWWPCVTGATALLAALVATVSGAGAQNATTGGDATGPARVVNLKTAKLLPSLPQPREKISRAPHYPTQSRAAAARALGVQLPKAQPLSF